MRNVHFSGLNEKVASVLIYQIRMMLKENGAIVPTGQSVDSHFKS